MKKVYTLFLTLIITGCLMAQAPQSFKYQAVARDASGDVVANQPVGMQISILQSSTSGIAVYVETFTPTTNEFGLMNLNIGAGTPVSGDLTTIDWSADTYFIKIEMDITGGTTYEEYGTSQFLSVPYALHAKTAANIFSGNYSDLIGTPSNVSTFTNDAGYLTSITESDPLFTAWDKTTGINITESHISDLDHFTNTDETDQIFTASVANNITTSDTTRWGSASGTEADPLFTAWNKSTGISITESQISDLVHFTTTDEIDPIFGVHAANGITPTNITNWTTAFGWGNHSTAGYLTSFTEVDPIFTDWDKRTGISILESQISDFGNYESAFTKNTAFNKNFGNSTGTITEGNDSRLSDARTPTSHAASHTDGSDDIQDATNSQKGLMTATYATKLEGIAAGAEVNVATNLSVGTKTATALDINSSTGTNVTIPAATTDEAGLMTDAQFDKLEGIAAGAEINVNADWNASSGDAQIFNKPSDLTDLSIHDVTELADISDEGSGIIISSIERNKLSGIETGANVTDATNVNAAGAVMETDFNANTMLLAIPEDTPVATSKVGVLSFLNVEDGAEVNEPTNLNIGNKTATTLDINSSTGTNVTIPAANTTYAGLMTNAQFDKLSGIETGANVTDATNVNTAGAVMESDFNAGTFLYATSDNTPQPKTVSETKTILSLENVENTALSTWAGSGNITSLGTVTSGTLGTGAALADVTMSLGSDADGDIYYRSGSKLTRLPTGTDDQVLTLESSVPAWKDASGGSTTYTVGDFALGGIVFWVDETGQHGLVCAKTDQNSGRWYAGTYGNTQAKGDGPLAGEMNTAIIIASQVAIGDDGSTYAARICAELQITEGGKTYGDWYLPSKEELNLMYQNKATIDVTAIANGGNGFASDYYWSSTEYGNKFRFAWNQDFGNGGQGYGSKDTTYYVRAIRAF